MGILNKQARWIIGWTSLALITLLALLIWVTYTQETIGGADTAPPVETCTQTPTEPPVTIVFVDEIPTAVAFTETPTETPKPTPTPRIAPTETPKPTQKPTETPKKPTNTPRTTNSPTPKKNAQETQNIVPYPTGKVGTQKVDEPERHTWKPYARYWKITRKNSAEYRLQQIAHTAGNGLRVVTDPNGVERYCIALAPQWAGGKSVDIGRCIDIKMKNGATLHCVLGDCKKHENTQNKQGRYGSKGELVEFIVDETKLPSGVNGDISNVSAEFKGGVVSITVLDLYIKGFGR